MRIEEQREQLRLSLIRFLVNNLTEYGQSETLLLTQARNEGRPALTLHEVRAELVYLEEKGLAKVPAKELSPELRHWRITAAGRDYAAAHGLDHTA